LRRTKARIGRRVPSVRLILFVAGIATARSLAIGLLFHLLFA